MKLSLQKYNKGKMSFELNSEDKKFLNVKFNNWGVLEANSERGVIIDNYLLPKGYNVEEVTLMVLIPPNYPPSALDMFYVTPNIQRLDGKEIQALCIENHLGREWQRWSRHYTWNPLNHSLATHLLTIEVCLKKELKK